MTDRLRIGGDAVIAEDDATGDVLVDVDSVDTERLNNAHVYASAFGAGGAACQAALDELGDSPSVVHLDVEVAALGANAPLEVPSNTIVYIEADITLADATVANIIQTKDAFTQATGVAGSTPRSNIDIIGAGGTLDGNKANQTAGTDGFDQCGVHIYADESSVRGVRIRNAAIHGLSVVGGTEDIGLVGNYCRGNAASQIHAHFRTTGGDDGDGAFVRNIDTVRNTCVGGDNSGSLRYAGVESGSIANNTVRDHVTSSDNHGIRIYQGDYPDAGMKGRVTVSENRVSNVAGHGIVFDSSTQDGTLGSYGDTVIESNDVDTADHGIVVQARQNPIAHATVADNQVHNCQRHGIRVIDTVLGVSFDGNVLTSNGLSAFDITGGLADENVYDGNIARGNGTNALSGTGAGSVVGDNVGL